MYPPYYNQQFDPAAWQQQYQPPPQAPPQPTAPPPQVSAPTSDWFAQNSPTAGVQTSQAPGAPPPSAPAPSPQTQAAPPRDPRAVEDLWFQFLTSKGFAGGQSGRGAGFFTGGQSFRGQLAPLVAQFNQMTGLQAQPIGDDSVDFGFGKQDVITSGGDWWVSPVGGGAQAGGGGGGGAPQPAAPAMDQMRMPSGMQPINIGLGPDGQPLPGGPGASSGMGTDGGFGGVPKPFSYGDFLAPKLGETTDPGYEARLRLGEQAVQRGAAAKGSLLTGGTLKELNRYGQDYASGEYGNVFNRAKTGYETNRGNALENYLTNYGIKRGAENDYWSRLNDVTNRGLSATLGSRY